MRGTEGFGLIQVMVAAAVVGIVSLNFLQKARGRVEVSMIADLMSYRDNVLDYYTAVAADRSSYECLKQNNPTLRSYVESGTSLGVMNVAIWDSDRGKDSAGNPIPGGGCNRIVIPSAGLGIEITDDFPAYEWVQKPSVAPFLVTRHCPDHASSTDGAIVKPGEPYFCLRAKIEGEGTAPGVRMTISIEYFPVAHQHLSIELKERERVLFFNRTVAKNCGEGRLLGLYDHRGETLPDDKRSLAYLGDAAVIGFNSEKKGVECSPNPLVVPPCYDPDDVLFKDGSASGWGGPVEFIATRRCDIADDPRWQGRCPRPEADNPLTPGDERDGITAITRFDKDTGLSQCSTVHILIAKPMNPVCEGDERNAVTVVEGDGKITDSCSDRLNRGGVKPEETCADDDGIRGWRNDGDSLGCNTITTGEEGIPGSDCHRKRVGYWHEHPQCHPCGSYLCNPYDCNCTCNCSCSCTGCCDAWGNNCTCGCTGCCTGCCSTCHQTCCHSCRHQHTCSSPICWRRGIELPNGSKIFRP